MKRHLKRWICVALSCVMVAILATGCGSGSAGGAKTTLNFALASDISSLDPIHNYEVSSFCVVNNIAESLLTFDSDGVTLKPCLASSWEEVDSTTYTYQIRDDVCFSDGTPMTMDDVLFSLQRTMDPESSADMAWLFDDVESIEQTGDWELTVKLANANPLWKYYAATSACQIISKSYCEEKGDAYGTAEGNILATGPYVCDSWTMDSEIVLKKNENYWDKSADIDIDTIHYYIISDEAARTLAMKSGQVDIIVSPSVDMLSNLEEIPGVEILQADSLYDDDVAFNCMKAPFDDENFRKACAYAIDAVSIRESVYGEYAEDATGLPFGKAMYTVAEDVWNEAEGEMESYAYDLDKAKEYLAKSAYPDGTDVTLMYYTKNANKNEALAIQANLAEIGVNVTLDEVSPGDYWSYVYGTITDDNDIRDYEMMVGFWIPDAVDPSGFANIMYNSNCIGRGGCNTAAYSNPDVDQLILEANSSTDNTERSTILAEAIKTATDACPYKNLFYRKQVTAVNTDKLEVDYNVMWQYNLLVKDFKVKTAE